MAEPFISLLLTKVEALIAAEVGLVYNLKNDLEDLKSELQAIHSAVKVADGMPYFMAACGEDDWLQKLKDVAYDAEDIIDEYQVSLSNRQRMSSKSNEVYRALMCSISCFSEHVYSRYQLGNEIKNINQRLGQIAKERQNYRLDESVVARNESKSSINGTMRAAGSGTDRETSPHMIEKYIIGRDDDKEALVQKLLLENSVSVPVISIVGIGGVGKSTLARMVFNDVRVKEHFEGHTWWVCASERPEAREMARKILEVITKESIPNLQLSILCEKLMANLSEKKFLLVLDDIWDLDWWGQLEASVMNAASGSRILITTRKKEVSNEIKATYVHEPKCLQFKQSWSLFLSKALKESETTGSLEGVIDIAKSIVRKCGGLPLVVQAIGRVMYFKGRTRKTWESILDSKIWEWKSSASSSDGILPGLILSYDDLIPNLKRCFVYFSVFPKDYEIKKEELVKHWMAQGFVAGSSDQDMELTAEGYFNDLVGRSLIEHRGYDQVFGMHGVIHDLAMYIGRREYGLNLTNERIRHLSLTNKVHECSLDPSRLQVPQLLRTLFCPLDYLESLPLEKVFNSLKRLRVLDLRGSNVKVLPEAIWELPILKYLNLSHTKVEELPASVGRLHSLQTLNLDYSKIKRIRKEISRLFNLRHLELRGTSHLEFMAEGLGKLTGLRTLDKFIVSDGNEQDGACNLRELKNLNRLRGRLVIARMERVKDKSYATEAQLHKKENLTNLKLEYERQMDVSEMKKEEAVLAELRPPTHLERMELDGYVGRMLPLSWLDNNSSLRVLRLEQCRSLETLPALPVMLTDLDLSYCSELIAIPSTAPSLKSLIISFCPQISTLPFFPTIETIEVASLDSWEGWASGRTTYGETVASMPCLQELKILNCQRLKHLPPRVFPGLEYLMIKGCGQLHVLWEDEQDPNSSQEEAVDLPRLKFLKLEELQELSALTKGTTSLPMLEELRIELCPRLTWLPEGLLQDLPQLTTLLLLDLEELTCLARETIKLPKLERLWVGSCPKLTSQQLDALLQNHAQLTHLMLEELQELSALVRGDANLLQLEEMRIELCPKLSSLPDGLLQSLPRLRKLELLQLEQMTSLYAQGTVSLPKLESLWVTGCPKLSSQQLGGLMQDLPQLTSLFLGWLTGLRSLPQQITNLPKLEILKISHCPKLASLPDGLTRRLGSGLDISNCQGLL